MQPTNSQVNSNYYNTNTPTSLPPPQTAVKHSPVRATTAGCVCIYCRFTSSDTTSEITRTYWACSAESTSVLLVSTSIIWTHQAAYQFIHVHSPRQIKVPLVLRSLIRIFWYWTRVARCLIKYLTLELASCERPRYQRHTSYILDNTPQKVRTRHSRNELRDQQPKSE